MRKAIAAAALALSAVGCGDSTPTTTMPPVSKWTLSGTVRSNGAALNGASVSLRGWPLPSLITQTITDASGGYVFPLVAEGTYLSRLVRLGT